MPTNLMLQGAMRHPSPETHGAESRFLCDGDKEHAPESFTNTQQNLIDMSARIYAAGQMMRKLGTRASDGRGGLHGTEDIECVPLCLNLCAGEHLNS